MTSSHSLQLSGELFDRVETVVAQLTGALKLLPPLMAELLVMLNAFA